MTNGGNGGDNDGDGTFPNDGDGRDVFFQTAVNESPIWRDSVLGFGGLPPRSGLSFRLRDVSRLPTKSGAPSGLPV